MHHVRSHVDGFPLRGVGVNGLAYFHHIGAHLDGQGDLTDHVIEPNNLRIALKRRLYYGEVTQLALITHEHRFRHQNHQD